MNNHFKFDIGAAARLSRAGKFKEALAALGGLSGAAPSPAHKPARPEGLSPLFDQLGRLKGDLIANMRGAGPAPATDDPRFKNFSFSNDAGTRSYKLFVPTGYRGQKVALVVMLHGCTQSPDDFAAGTRMNDVAEEQTFLVAYPAQSKTANSSKCWNWFNAADQKRDRGEPSLIAGITRQVMTEFSVDRSRVFIAGLSAGGAAAANMAALYADLYAAVGIHSGLACGVASDVAGAFAAMRQGATVTRGSHQIPTIVFHGDNDRTVHPQNGDHIVAQAKAARELEATVTTGETGGMTYTRSVQTDSDGTPVLEQWELHGAGHAWSGGSKTGSFADPRGPHASREMTRFFMAQKPRAAAD